MTLPASDSLHGPFAIHEAAASDHLIPVTSLPAKIPAQYHPFSFNHITRLDGSACLRQNDDYFYHSWICFFAAFYTFGILLLLLLQLQLVRVHIRHVSPPFILLISGHFLFCIRDSVVIVNPYNRNLYIVLLLFSSVFFFASTVIRIYICGTVDNCRCVSPRQSVHQFSKYMRIRYRIIITYCNWRVCASHFF